MARLDSSPEPVRPAFAVAPPCPMARPPGVDLWRARLVVPDDRFSRLARHLSDGDRVRAGRLVNDGLRRKFVARRGLLREVLSRYLAVAPMAIEFAQGRYGRPRIVLPETPFVEFSVSDSGDLALFAVSASGPLGVDLERLREIPDADRIAERWFPAAERDAVRAASGAMRLPAFFRAWTRLEARWKAMGTGLAAMWGGARGDTAAALSAEEPTSLVPEEGYVAAVLSPCATPSWRFWEA